MYIKGQVHIINMSANNPNKIISLSMTTITMNKWT